MRCAARTLAPFALVGAMACGDAGDAGSLPQRAGAAKPTPAPSKEATLVLTNEDGTEERVPYRQCAPEEHQKLTALVGAILMKAIGDAPSAVRRGGFATKLHVAVRATGKVVFGDAVTSCGDDACPREEARAIETLARQAVAQSSLQPPPTAACVTSLNLRMQGQLGP